MLSGKSSGDEYWCPLADGERAVDANGMSAAERAALARIGGGEWVSDAEIARLQDLGLAERAFGQALLTRRGRAALGLPREDEL
jgi:hypothetical protein